jgi:hypothetical protein
MTGTPLQPDVVKLNKALAKSQRRNALMKEAFQKVVNNNTILIAAVAALDIALQQSGDDLSKRFIVIQE